jgi:hypothetical protein
MGFVWRQPPRCSSRPLRAGATITRVPSPCINTLIINGIEENSCWIICYNSLHVISTTLYQESNWHNSSEHRQLARTRSTGEEKTSSENPMEEEICLANSDASNIILPEVKYFQTMKKGKGVS